MVNAVTMRGANRYRTGVYVDSTLTKAAVKEHGLKVTSWQVLPGDLRGTEGQALIAPGVQMQDGTTRDLCLYINMANVACAFDANATEELPPPLWSRELGRPIDVTQEIDWHLINQHAGAFSTGCLDVAAGVFYGVVWTSPDGDWRNAQHFFHAIRIADGSPVHEPLPFAEVSYTAPGGVKRSFRSVPRKQRGALLLDRGTVFIPFGSAVEDAATNEGWLIAYDAEYQALSGAICKVSSSRGVGAGLWNGGGGVCADDDGFLYALTSNGTFAPPTDWGESFLKLRYTRPARGGFTAIDVVDNWTPWTDDAMTDLAPDGTDLGVPRPTNLREYTKDEAAGLGDLDLGSGAPVLNMRRRTVLGMGKHGILYSVHMDKMGGTRPADLDAPQENYAKLATKPIFATYNGLGLNATPDDPRDLPVFYTGRTQHQHGEGVLWTFGDEQRIYVGGENNSIRCYRIEIDNSLTALGWTAEWASSQASPNGGGMPGSMLTLSWDGSDPETAVLWAIQPYGNANTSVTNGRLLAYDPLHFGTYSDGNGHMMPIWDSEATGQSFLMNKFNRAVPADHLFVPTYGGDIMRLSLNT